MEIQIIIFGQLAEITGKSLTVAGIVDTNSLVAYLHKNFPALEKVKYKIAVDKKLVNQNTLLTENCEVALLPPFSGG
jgi:molybdopterin converting factor small subunit